MIDFKDAGIKPLSGLEIELRNMTGVDWSNYVQHVVKADELFTQYGCEPTEELIECINTMTPNVIYYSVYLKQENNMVGYVGVTGILYFSGIQKNGYRNRCAQFADLVMVYRSDYRRQRGKN